jgi:hypothetical protein
MHTLPTEIQYAALKVEIAKPAYNGMTDEQVAASINSQTFADPVDILSQKAINALLFTTAGDWAKVVSVADGITNATAQVRTRCVSVKELFTRNVVFEATDDTRWTRFIAVVDALISDAQMSAEGKTALVNMRTVQAPLWHKFAYRPLEWSDVAVARTFNG